MSMLIHNKRNAILTTPRVPAKTTETTQAPWFTALMQDSAAVSRWESRKEKFNHNFHTIYSWNYITIEKHKGEAVCFYHPSLEDTTSSQQLTQQPDQPNRPTHGPSSDAARHAR